jgi:integrase
MGLYRRAGSKYWYMRIRGGKCQSTGIPHSGSTADHTKQLKKDAQAVLDTALANRAKGRAGLPVKPTDPWTLDRLAQWYLEHRVARRPGAARARIIVAMLRKAFAGLLVTDITRQRIEELRTARVGAPIRRVGQKAEQKRKASTVNREMAELSIMLTAAVELGQLPTNPIARLRKLRTDPVRRQVLAPEDEAKLLAQLAPADRALFLCGLDGLIRLGNLLDLQWQDVNLSVYTAYIRDPKDPRQGEPFTAVLSTRAVEALKRLERNGPYVFWHRRGAALDRDRRGAVRAALEHACKRADIKYGREQGGIVFHWATRRTGATRMIQAGADIKTVQEAGHWSRPDVVLEIYTASSLEQRRAAAEAVQSPLDSRHVALLKQSDGNSAPRKDAKRRRTPIGFRTNQAGKSGESWEK